jgi:hypothetical protein
MTMSIFCGCFEVAVAEEDYLWLLTLLISVHKSRFFPCSRCLCLIKGENNRASVPARRMKGQLPRCKEDRFSTQAREMSSKSTMKYLHY